MISIQTAFAPDIQHTHSPELSAVIPYDAVAAALGKVCAKVENHYGAKSAIGEACTRVILARLSGRDRVHAEAYKVIEARQGPQRRAQRSAESAGHRSSGARSRHGRVNEILHHVRHAIGKAAGFAGRARTHAGKRVSSLHAFAQQVPQRLRDSFRQRRAAGGTMKSSASPVSAAAMSSAASRGSKSKSPDAFSTRTAPAAMQPDASSGMTMAFRLTQQDTMRNSAATASFKDDGVTLDNLVACLGSQSQRPLRGLVTGMKFALQTALPDGLPAQTPAAEGMPFRPHSESQPQSQALPASPDTHVVARFDPMRAMIRKSEGMESRLAELSRDFPLAESVYERLRPWGDVNEIEKLLVNVADDAAALYCSPQDYLLMRYARPLSDDIQYTRRFMQALDDVLATVTQGA